MVKVSVLESEDHRFDSCQVDGSFFSKHLKELATWMKFSIRRETVENWMYSTDLRNFYGRHCIHMQTEYLGSTEANNKPLQKKDNTIIIEYWRLLKPFTQSHYNPLKTNHYHEVNKISHKPLQYDREQTDKYNLQMIQLE